MHGCLQTLNLLDSMGIKGIELGDKDKLADCSICFYPFERYEPRQYEPQRCGRCPKAKQCKKCAEQVRKVAPKCVWMHCRIQEAAVRVVCSRLICLTPVRPLLVIVTEASWVRVLSTIAQSTVASTLLSCEHQPQHIGNTAQNSHATFFSTVKQMAQGICMLGKIVSANHCTKDLQFS